MKKIGLFFLLAISSGILITCSDKSSDPGKQQVKTSLTQVGGCGSHQLGKVSMWDSCFTYQFDQNLEVNFFLSGNCCPDSNRFLLSNRISNDTIFVVAMDTAAQVCNCVCNYTINAKFENLSLSHYVFYCTRADDSNRVYYAKDVYRSK
ncbi:MAG TPA: hypothetical protein VLX91_06410 [Candidatus Acidoferrales bacterium]|nr:hypothetical protein [Candidatus Acidoferrales bacterium]